MYIYYNIKKSCKQIQNIIYFYYKNKDDYMKNNYEQINIEEYVNDKNKHYENLIDKYSKGKKLTDEELNELKNASNYDSTSNKRFILILFLLFTTIVVATIFITLLKI